MSELTDGFHVYVDDATGDLMIESRSELARWVLIPMEEWERLVREWYEVFERQADG